jgi:hypothetical protein
MQDLMLTGLKEKNVVCVLLHELTERRGGGRALDSASRKNLAPEPVPYASDVSGSKMMNSCSFVCCVLSISILPAPS